MNSTTGKYGETLIIGTPEEMMKYYQWTPDATTLEVMNTLETKGVSLMIYRDSLGRHYDDLLVYNRKELKQALNIPIIERDSEPASTFIELETTVKLVNDPESEIGYIQW